MYSKLTYRLKKNENKYGAYLGSIFQGFLMENIDSEYADYLHEKGTHPYSQYVTTDDDYVYWNIRTMNAQAKENIIDRFIKEKIREVKLKHRNEILKIEGMDIDNIESHEFVEKYYNKKCPKTITIEFLTPTAFKRNGSICFFPDLGLIFQSLINKFNKSEIDAEIDYEQTMEDIAENVYITRYNLKSTTFALEGTNIPAFTGNITIKIKGNENLTSVLWLLAKYGEYSGVGIKNAIGMGAINVKYEKRENKK